MHNTYREPRECFTCARVRFFDATYRNGTLVELACTECGTTDSFPYDDED